ncbi:MAG: hypothetical protein HKO99_14025 [Xanthomonadales bacterium]|nr:hypothetical protein [Gammaproteobacteria bacterium]NNK52707.1 hypothetical protein [Xanthomonadales bacterium]
MEVTRLKDRASDPDFPGINNATAAFASAVASMLIFFSPLAVGQSSDTPAPADTPTELHASAQRAYLDPVTGRLLSKPPPDAPVMRLSPEELNMLSTSDAGLVEAPLPDGGYMLDLQGRFQHMAVATLADDGTIEIRDFSGEVFLPADSEQPEQGEKRD